MTKRFLAISILAALVSPGGHGQITPAPSAAPEVAAFDVTGTVHYSGESSRDGAVRHSMQAMRRRTVVWLEPVDLAISEPDPPGNFKMIQKDKEFHPRLLVVPVGSTVSFPNADPYFHNVFSLFNGRRFDLGLYQSGQTRNVAFNRKGISYIFCNIHPEMSAVIISLNTPYYALPDADGLVALHGVPKGIYRLEVWSELASPETLSSLSRIVKVDQNVSALGKIDVTVSSHGISEHLNKFGMPYDTHSATTPY